MHNWGVQNHAYEIRDFSKISISPERLLKTTKFQERLSINFTILKEFKKTDFKLFVKSCWYLNSLFHEDFKVTTICCKKSAHILNCFVSLNKFQLALMVAH